MATALIKLGMNLNKLFRLGQKVIWAVDAQLDKLTSYRLVLYCLIADVVAAILLSFSGQVPFKWYQLLASAVFLLIVCRATNWLLARSFNVPTNKESDLITALILSLIINSASSFHGFLVLAIAAVVAMASKYLLVIGRRHIFNPAAFGAVISGLLLSNYASWWIGTAALLPVVALGGLAIERKTSRLTMAAFFGSLVFCLLVFTNNGSLSAAYHAFWSSLFNSPLIFFISVMLIEPQTTPSTLKKYLPVAAVVAAVFSLPQFHLTLEEGLLFGNGLGFLLEPNQRFKLTLWRVEQNAQGIQSFLFRSAEPLVFKAGQYMELTLPQNQSDSRGNRRYFTIASSPTERGIRFSLKLPPKMSAFKRGLSALMPGDYLLAAKLAGSFTLPKNKDQKLVFIAGGIGITPFRSIIQWLLDSHQNRNIHLLYAATDPAEFAFRDIFAKAARNGLKTDYLVTTGKPAESGPVLRGPLSAEVIKTLVPDYPERLFYISGPYGMVKVAKLALLEAGVSPRRIKQDYFPGYG